MARLHCPLCDIESDDGTEVATHIVAQHDLTRQSNQADSRKELYRKKMILIQVEGFACLLCNFENANEEALKAHITQRHNVDQGTVTIQIPEVQTGFNYLG